MRLKIRHVTEYSYDGPVAYALQRLRMVPHNASTQNVGNWRLKVTGAREQVRFTDHFGNDTRLISVEGSPQVVTVEAAGEVETFDRAGVVGEHRGFAPLWLFEQGTPLTEAGEGIAALIEPLSDGSELDRLHRLMAAIGEKVVYEIGATGTETTAEQALAVGRGVCQDHAHVFATAARSMGFPARYVSGYLMLDDAVEQAASHAWAEAHVSGLGWVAFDPANAISPDERYVRVAVGRDFRDASPASGIRLGQAGEHLAVRISVEQ